MLTDAELNRAIDAAMNISARDHSTVYIVMPSLDTVNPYAAVTRKPASYEDIVATYRNGKLIIK